MYNLDFVKMNAFTWVAKAEVGNKLRFYHVINHGSNAGLKIYGDDNKQEIMYRSVKAAMSIAVREHTKWLNSIKERG